MIFNLSETNTGGGGTPVINPLSVNANGTYTAPSGVDGYSPVTVNVPTVKFGVLRTDSELIQSFTYDKLLVSDGVISSIPAYSTTSKTLVASDSLTPTITMSYADYHYYVIERMYVYPVYNTSAKAAGRQEYHFTAAVYEMAQVQEEVFSSLDGTPYGSRVFSIPAAAVSRLIYWDSASSMAGYSGTAQGLMMNAIVPTASSGVLTIKSPSITLKGNATYLNSTYFGATTDIRAQYIIEVFRVPNTTPLIGWGITQQLLRMADNIASSSHTLT